MYMHYTQHQKGSALPRCHLVANRKVAHVFFFFGLQSDLLRGLLSSLGAQAHFRSCVLKTQDPAYHFLHFEVAPNAKMNGLGAAFVCSQAFCQETVVLSKIVPEFLCIYCILHIWYI